MVTTNDEALWRAMWAYKDHGKSYEAVYEREHPPGYRWLCDGFGTNWRMLEVQAAIGRIQLRHMPDWLAQRTRNASALNRALAQFAGPGGVLHLPEFPDHSVHACYKWYAYVRPENLAPGWTRDRIVEAVGTAGVPCYQGSCSEVYLEKAFDNTDWRPAQRLANARELGETSMMFMVHPTLTGEEIGLTCRVISDVVQQASLS